MIKPESIEKLLSVVDIVEVVEGYVELKKSGRNFVGICPFHDDKHPSMSVSSSLGIFHCFSCKAGGNAIKFIMDFEKIGFIEAAEKLAAKYNFALEYSNNFDKTQKLDKKILENLNAFFVDNLFKNIEAQKYLLSRGITQDLAQKFSIGYAPQNIITLRFLQNNDISEKEAIECGVLKQNENGVYASFIDRITFAIKNPSGKIVGFGGRTLTNHPAKYVNSPQSYIFDKSKILYAYDLAKKSAYDKKELIITEGYMDVISLHKAGFTNAVAVLGTALTQSHIPLIKRANLKVILSFDGDTAGINAAIRSSEILTTNGIDGGVAIIKNGADPADLVLSNKISEIENLYTNATEMGEFLIRQICAKYEISRPQQKQLALNEILAYLAKLPNIVAKSYRLLISEILKISPDDFVIKNRFIQQNQKIVTKTHKNYLELQVLKTMLLDNRAKIEILDLCERECFMCHCDIFDAINSNTNDAKIRELELSEVDVFKSYDELKNAAKILKIGFLNRKILDIKNSNNPEKIDIIMNLNRAIMKLKGLR